MSITARRGLVGIALVSLIASTGLPAYGAVAPARLTSRSAVASLPFTFKAFGYGIHDLQRDMYPYARDVPIARRDTAAHDVRGVRLVRVEGRLYDHPVAQASYGLVNLESYRISRDTFYLERAKLQAERLIQRAQRYRGAWYLPYPFSFDKHGLKSERMKPPWYSAMAQGQGLSFFVRLYEVTGDSRYREAANGVFATFLRPRGSATPWTVWVDGSGYLWLEEYAGPRPDRTYNGQMFAVWGLWDYWRLSQDTRAQRLWDGGLTTLMAYASTIRNAGWVSSYCMSHPWSINQEYHEIHIHQLVSLYQASHHPALVRFAEILVEDYPPPDVGGTVRFAPGRHHALRFGTSGQVIDRRATWLRQASSARADRRIRVKGRTGYWYRMATGVFAGYYVQEQPPSVALHGTYLAFSWTPPRVGRLPAGRAAVGYSFATNGSVISTRRVTPSSASTFQVSKTAHWNGVRHALAADGLFAGYWLPVSAIILA